MASFFKIAVPGQRESTACATGTNARALHQTLVILTVAWLLVIYLFSDTVLSAAAQWRHSQTFSHCFLILPITLYLMWRQRERIIGLAPAPNYWGLPLLGLIGAAWLLGHIGVVLVVQQLAVVAMLQALVFTIAGWPVTRAFLFPLTFLIFAVPFGDDLVPPLQSLTALFTVKALQLSGIPVFRDGWWLVTPTGVWEIAEACAGIRYVIPSVILGYLFSYYGYRSWRRRLCFILFCFFTAIVANGIRAYGIVVVAHLTNNRLAIGVDHVIAGWVFHSLVILALFWLGLMWRESATVDSNGDAARVQRMAKTIPVPAPWVMGLTALCAVALLSLAPLGAERLLQSPAAPATSKLSIPVLTGSWQALEDAGNNWRPDFPGAQAVLRQSYLSEQQRVDLFIGYYRTQQRQGAELVGAANILIDEKNWRRISVGSARVVAEGYPVAVAETVIRSPDQVRLMWSWYWVGGEYTSNRYLVKLLEIKNVLLREHKGSAFIALAADVKDENRRQAAAVLHDFLRHVTLSDTLNKMSN
jgi:exosortase A